MLRPETLLVLALFCLIGAQAKTEKVECGSSTKKFAGLSDGDMYEVTSHAGYDDREDYEDKAECKVKFKVRSYSLRNPFYTKNGLNELIWREIQRKN